MIFQSIVRPISVKILSFFITAFRPADSLLLYLINWALYFICIIFLIILNVLFLVLLLSIKYGTPNYYPILVSKYPVQQPHGLEINNVGVASETGIMSCIYFTAKP